MRLATSALLAAGVALFMAAQATSAEAQDTQGYAAGYGVTIPARTELAYSDFLDKVQQGTVANVVMSGDRIWGELKDGASFLTVSPESNNSALIETLIRNKVKVTGEHSSAQTPWSTQTLLLAGPFLLLLAVLAYRVWPSVRQKQPGAQGTGESGFGRSRARRLDPAQATVSFKDVAGIEETKQEVAELVEFLKDPARFHRLGARIPRGVLMTGPPGTGKTLLARAIAGEAGVPFFATSGSDFVEMFVGVGAARVRDLFDQAKKHPACILFIDEIDAVGRHRSAGLGGGSDEREQTLNQLLVEMDGFEGNQGIIVIAATNRPDVLDAALLRPGRFDRQVVVPLPDVRGREQIVRVHTRQVPLADDVSPAMIARAAPGFSGAELANLVNEAALFAARANKDRVYQDDFLKARDKIVMGAERRSFAMSVQDRELTAYHEAGHAIVGINMPEHDPLYKVSIIPRGRALGVTVYLPEADRCSYTREFLESRLCALFGGRLAEELIFGAHRVTTGAANDIERATEIARCMVTRYGMSEKLGPLTYGTEVGATAGRGTSPPNDISHDTACAIDREVREIIDRQYARARQILEVNLDVLHRMARALLEHETIDTEQIAAIVQGPEVLREATSGELVRADTLCTRST